MDLKNSKYLNFNINNSLAAAGAAGTHENNYKPKLIEPGVKYFFKNILKNCNNFKQQNYTLFYNIFMFALFFGILGIILYVKYKGNKSPEEHYLKNQKDKQYIMSKLVYYNRQNLDNNQRIRNNMITNLPDYNNHPEASQLHKKIYF